MSRQTLTNYYMADDKQKADQDEQERFQTYATIDYASQLHDAYLRLTKIIHIPLCKSQEILSQSNISYNPNNSHELFSFEVEKIFSSFPFYRINAKFGHFQIGVNVLKCANSNFAIVHSDVNEHHNIYFVNCLGKEACIKQFEFKNEDDFQRAFILAVKEWIILKICSSLQCAPCMENYFGFDIVIYENSIQFACEKGQPITQLSVEQQEQLRKMLSLIHSFKIIHYDIKPQNIVFSTHYGKPVFIDFGFSEIIKEDQGFKTFSVFKGTPNFTSPEMLSIMKEASNFVDLYYNDAFGLDLTIKYIKNSPKPYLYEEPEDYIYDLRDTNQLNNEKSKDQFIFFNFQYQYLNGKEHKARQLLGELIKSSNQYISKILGFIKKVLKQVFISSIFNDDLRSFGMLDEYTEVKQGIKSNLEKVYLKPKWYEHSAGSEAINDAQIQPVSYNGAVVLTRNFDNFTKIILEEKQFTDTTIHVLASMIFECVRFDVQNLQFYEKLHIVDYSTNLLLQFLNNKGKNLHLMDKTNERQLQVEEVEKIRQFMVLLLQLCFETPVIKWSKDHIFDIFEQTIILDTDMSPLIDRLFAFINRNFTSANDTILAAIECDRVRLSAKMIASDYIQKAKAAGLRLESFAQSKIAEFKEKAVVCHDKQVQSIYKILGVLEKTRDKYTDQGFLQAKSLLPNIKNTKIRRNLLYLLVQSKINESFNYLDSENIFELIDSVKFSELRKLDFFSFTRLNLKLVNFFRSVSDLVAYCNLMRKIINCDAIYKKFYIVMMQNAKQQNLISTDDKITYFLKKFPYQLDKKTFLSWQLSPIITELHNMTIISHSLHEKIMLLYQLYEKQSAQIKLYDYKQIKSYFQTFNRVQIEFFFYFYHEKTKGVFLNNFNQLKEQYKQFQGTDPAITYKLTFYCFRFKLYESKIHLSEHRFRQSTRFLLQLIKLCEKLDLGFLAVQIFIDLNYITIYEDDMGIILTTALMFYEFCKKNSSFDFYLGSLSLEYSLIVLTNFFRYQIELFYQLLQSLVKVICRHPLENYFYSFMAICDKFAQKDQSYLRALHYSQFRNIDLQANPYMLIFYIYSIPPQSDEQKARLFKTIALNCVRLTDFSKRKILQKYYAELFRFVARYYSKVRRRHIFRNGKCYMSDSLIKKREAEQLYKLGKKTGSKGVANAKIMSKPKRLIQSL